MIFSLRSEHIEMCAGWHGASEQPALIPVDADGIWPDPTGIRSTAQYSDSRRSLQLGAMCAEGLAHPHTKVLRPIVFDPALAAGRDECGSGASQPSA